jgi:GH24 family phage-related lysozyme (muramidase)
MSQAAGGADQAGAEPCGAQSLSKQSLSEQGLKFLSAHESLAGVSNHLYWPGGASGVTLGAGYDMKRRTKAGIEADLAAIGLAAAVCARVSQAAGLVGAAARGFAYRNAGLVSLTPDQEMALLLVTAPPYEDIVHRQILVPLVQHQFDALVSFAYNPGGPFGPVAGPINRGDHDTAMAEIRNRVFSGGHRLDDLVRRRRDETELFVSGSYRPG